jgi:hypothetical protein
VFLLFHIGNADPVQPDGLASSTGTTALSANDNSIDNERQSAWPSLAVEIEMDTFFLTQQYSATAIRSCGEENRSRFPLLIRIAKVVLDPLRTVCLVKDFSVPLVISVLRLEIVCYQSEQSS